MNFQVVLGGPFLPHIEGILRDKASSMHSPVVLAADTGNRCTLRSIHMFNGKPCQTCDMVVQTERDFHLVRAIKKRIYVFQEYSE